MRRWRHSRNYQYRNPRRDRIGAAQSSENPKLVLADYFDYVAGTTTGAIMAILIALGYSVDQLRDFYLRSGAEMFHKARLW